MHSHEMIILFRLFEFFLDMGVKIYFSDKIYLFNIFNFFFKLDRNISYKFYQNHEQLMISEL